MDDISAVAKKSITRSSKLMIALPPGGGPLIGLATSSQIEMDDHLRGAGIDPSSCLMGSAKLASADIVVDWSETAHIEFT
jgi:hypothetical protein